MIGGLLGTALLLRDKRKAPAPGLGHDRRKR